jgi:transglutaminase-like putative cysteine protease
MSISEHIAASWFDAFFDRQIQALVGIAFGMLVLAGQISLLPFFIFSLAYVLAILLQTNRFRRLTARQVNVASWFYLPLFLLDIFVWSHSFIPATLHLILAMLLLKIFQQKADRDYYQIILLSFLLVLAASSLTINFSFLAGFLTFLLCCLATLISFEIKRARALSTAEREKTGPLTSVKPTRIINDPSRQKQLIKAVYVLSACALAAIVLGGTLFFFGLPRFGSGYFSRVQNRYSTLTGFNDRIQLGGIGKIQLDSSVVMRIQFAHPFKGVESLKWRGVALDNFDGRNWSKQTAEKRRYFPVSRNFHLQNPEVPGERLSYQVLMEPSGTMFIFTLDQILNLEGRLSPLSFDPLDDSIQARLHPNQRLAYRAESYLRQNRKQFSIATAPPLPDLKPYLQLPTLDPRISQLARQIVDIDDSHERKADQVEKYLQQNCSYSLEQAAISSPQPLASFLFQRKSGHCEYFATAMVVLLRMLQVPCRIVNGFQGGEYNEVGEDYIVRGSNAHSWVEVFLTGKGWTPYDPTPASTANPEHNFFSKAFSNYWDAIELFWGQWILPYDDALQASLFNDFQQLSIRWTSQSRKVLQSREKWIQNWEENLRHWFESWFIRNQLVLLMSLPGVMLGAWLLLKVAPAIRWHWMRSHQAGKTASLQATRLYLDMLRLLRKKGMVKSPSQTPTEFAHSIDGEVVAEKVLFLTQHYNQSRFSWDPPEESEIDAAWKTLQSLRAKNL